MIRIGIQAADNDNGRVVTLSPRLYRSVIARGLGWLTLCDVSQLGRARVTALALSPCTGKA